MTDDANANLRAIIERTIAELIAFGFDEQGAARLLAVQGLIRVDDVERRRELLHLIDSRQFEDPASRAYTPDNDDDDDDALDGASLH